MSKYLIRFIPLEPYFFGNERTLNFPGKKSQYQNLYYVEGENTPMQSTLLGALRFLMLKKYKERKESDFSPLVDTQALIGNSSFSMQEHDQKFGIIKSLSPVFLLRKDNKHRLIPAPLDHNTDGEKELQCETEAPDEGEKPVIYHPLDNYQSIDTMDGMRLYSHDFNVKSGLKDGYLDLDNDKYPIVKSDTLFRSEMRVGIKRGEENGFFKKVYKKLDAKYCFAIYGVIDEKEDLNGYETTCFLGQGKSLFKVQFTKTEDKEDIVKKTEAFLQETHENLKEAGAATQRILIYCLGDAQTTPSRYEDTLFAITDTRDYRAMTTEISANTLIRSKSETLYHLLKAGSIFIVKDDAAAKAWIEKQTNQNAENIGFNVFVTTSEEVKHEIVSV